MAAKEEATIIITPRKGEKDFADTNVGNAKKKNKR